MCVGHMNGCIQAGRGSPPGGLQPSADVLLAVPSPQRPHRAFSTGCLDLIKRLTVLQAAKHADYFHYVHESPEVLTVQMHGLQGCVCVCMCVIAHTLWWAA